MQMGMVGLGRMGANMVRRLMRDGHECVVYDVRPESVAELESEGATGAGSLEEFVAQAATAARGLGDGAGRVHRRHADQLAKLLDQGDVMIDGGNSYYRDDIDRAETASSRRASTTSTSAPAAACTGSSAATA